MLVKKYSTRQIFKALEKKKERKVETFKVVMNKCISFIEKNVMLNNLSCFYQVPEFIVGYSMYSIEECIMYIQNDLKENGFVVNYFFPNILYISWNVKEMEVEKPREKKFVKSISNHKPSGKFVLNL